MVAEAGGRDRDCVCVEVGDGYSLCLHEVSLNGWLPATSVFNSTPWVGSVFTFLQAAARRVDLLSVGALQFMAHYQAERPCQMAETIVQTGQKRVDLLALYSTLPPGQLQHLVILLQRTVTSIIYVPFLYKSRLSSLLFHEGEQMFP